MQYVTITENLNVSLRSISPVELAMCHLMRMETDLDTAVILLLNGVYKRKPKLTLL